MGENWKNIKEVDEEVPLEISETWFTKFLEIYKVFQDLLLANSPFKRQKTFLKTFFFDMSTRILNYWTSLNKKTFRCLCLE